MEILQETTKLHHKMILILWDCINSIGCFISIHLSDISLTGIDCTIIAYFFGPLAVNLEVTGVELARPFLSGLTSHYAGESAAMTTATDVS